VVGNGGQGGEPKLVYFTAGPSDEEHGLFGSIAPATYIKLGPVTSTNETLTLNWNGGIGPYLIQEKFNLSDTNWMNITTTSNRTATVPLVGSSGFLRVGDHATNNVLLFTALLSGASERTNAVITEGLGSGVFSLEGTNLSYYVTYSGLSGPPTAAHIHCPASSSVAVGVIQSLTPLGSNTFGVVTGTLGLTPDQVTNLESGLIYANIHTGLNPGGEIRGQLVPSQYIANLTGTNEVTPVTTSATGTSTFTFVGDQLFYTVTYSGLSSEATAAHIHGPADPTQPAGVLQPLVTPTGTSGTLRGVLTLTTDQIGNLVDGLVYVNIHSVTNVNGEIRGQLTPVH